MSRHTRPRSRDLARARAHQAHQARRRQARQQLRAICPRGVGTLLRDVLARLDLVAPTDGLMP